tara:strand:- start:271 stop:438 length:168 start_codon:yes stop_codon:yes gene_type:complete
MDVASEERDERERDENPLERRKKSTSDGTTINGARVASRGGATRIQLTTGTIRHG